MKKIKIKRIKSIHISAALFTAEVILGALFIIYINMMNLIPHKYIIYASAALGGIALLQALLIILKRKKKAAAVVSSAFSGLLVIAFILSYSVVRNIATALYDLTGNTNEYTNVVLIVKKNSPMQDILDINSGTVGIRGIIDTENTEYALAEINKKVSNPLSTKEFIDFSSMVKALDNGSVECILINRAYLSLIEEDYPDFAEDTRIIYQSSIEKNIASSGTDTDADVPFSVYICGTDASGRLADVNILAVVNPVDKKVLLINIPRDYYVPLYGDKSKMDKLTHGGIYGIDCSLASLESVFDIKIKYYLKVDFSSVVNVVDALGGIKVNSEYSFSSKWSLNTAKTYKFKKGVNELDGKAALAFARERKSLPDGDVSRGKNQQAIINAILDKITSPAIITNFDEVMEAITSNCTTNISTEQISQLVRMQLTDMASWEIESISVTGTESYRTTYSYGSGTLFVFIPKSKSIKSAREKMIQTIMYTAPDKETEEAPKTDTPSKPKVIEKEDRSWVPCFIG